jgi:hypothetical protein
MLKIAITGKANSGKNTVSQLFCEAICSQGREPKHLAFADPIKEIAQILFPHIPNDHLYGASKYRSEIIEGAFKDGKPLTVRQLLIDIGTMGRDYNPTIWIETLRHRLETAHRQNPPVVIINDVRFKNEFDFLHQLGFYQIRLHRNEYTKIDHLSETDQDNIRDDQFDCVLSNNGTLEDLRKDVAKIAATFS